MSIYSIINWASGTTYNLYDFVLYQGNFYYSLINGNVGSTPSETSTVWAGTVVFSGLIYPNFFFKPSYSVQCDLEPKVDMLQFGDSYSQRIQKNINALLLKFNLKFDLRTSAEATAINHFLVQRSAVKSFVFTASAPFNIAKLYICRKWASEFLFKENFTITAQFEEVPA